MVELAVKELGAERVIYGSDVSGRSFGSQLAKVYGARISENEKQLIFSGNLRRILTPIMKSKGMSMRHDLDMSNVSRRNFMKASMVAAGPLQAASAQPARALTATGASGIIDTTSTSRAGPHDGCTATNPRIDRAAPETRSESGLGWKL